jgi:elongator complex protein 6
MSMRIPPDLSPYIQIPSPDSLVLLTSVQNANANWLILRYLYAAFGRDAQTRRTLHTSVDNAPELDRQDVDSNVLVVSWLRDLDFWQTEAKRAVVCHSSS